MVFNQFQGIDFTLGEGLGSAFFQGIEVNTPMLVSPIMMVPKYLTRLQLQEEYMKYVDDMALRAGPPVTSNKDLTQRSLF